jgi:hypothetical protein
MPAFAWREWGKPRNNWISAVGNRAETWIRDLSNTKLECQPLDYDVRSIFSLYIDGNGDMGKSLDN